MALDVHLRGEKVGRLLPERGGYSFAYDSGAVQRLGPMAMLSTALPTGIGRHGHDATRAYVEGLLPQGHRRRWLARALGVDPGDGYAMIAALGGDCPGAVTFHPEGEGEGELDPAALEWLDEEDLDEALVWPVRDPDSILAERTRFAVPGEHHKLALVREEGDGRWAWPQPGAPSTHILKPEQKTTGERTLNEHVCTSTLAAIGLPVAATERMATAGGHHYLVTRRFDRWGEGPGAERLHLESMRQALGQGPDDIIDTMEALFACGELLRSVGEEERIDDFFRVALGMWFLGDYSERPEEQGALLYLESGPVLAPFTEIVSTEAQERIGIEASLPAWEILQRNSVTRVVEKLAVTLQISPEPALLTAATLLGEIHAAIAELAQRATEEGWHGPALTRIQQLVESRIHGRLEGDEGFDPL